MTKKEKSALGLIAIAFGQMTQRLITIDKELMKVNSNWEQIEAHWVDAMDRRNVISQLFLSMSPQIYLGIKDLKDRIISAKEDNEKR